MGLVEAIRDRPEDDLPRLALADWYDDNDQAERAEFIRIQCDLARLGPGHPNYPDLHVRQLQLLAEHEANWLGEWTSHLVRWEFHRGLLTSITVGPSAFARAAPLFAEHPIDRVAFLDDYGRPIQPEAVRDVLSRPHLRFVRAIDAAGCRAAEAMIGLFEGTVATNTWLREMARSENAGRLEELSLFGGTRSGGREPIERDAFAAFSNAGHLSGLSRLNLGSLYEPEHQNAWRELVRVLVTARFAPALRSLYLSGCTLDDEAAFRLASAPALRGLTEIDLGGCYGIGDPGVEAIIQSPHLMALTSVSLPFRTALQTFAASSRLRQWQSVGLSGDASGRPVDPSAWAEFFRSPNLAPRRLRVSANLPADACVALGEAGWVQNLEELSLPSSINVEALGQFFRRLDTEHVSGLRVLRLPPLPEVVHFLASWPGLAGLTELSLSDGNDADVEPVLRSPHLSTRLSRLEVYVACRSRSALAALAGRREFAGLRHLGFGYNSLDREKMRALAASAFAPHLEALHLGSESDDWSEDDTSGPVLGAFEVLSARSTFPRLRNVVLGSGTDPDGLDLMGRRFGEQMRLWLNY